MSGINLNPLTSANAQVESAIVAAAGKEPTAPKTLWISAYQVDGEGNSPEYVRWSPTTEQIDRLSRMARLCQEEAISQIVLPYGPDAWGANPSELGSYEFNAGLTEAELVVSKERFWFRDKPKYDVPIESRSVTFEELSEALASSEQHVLFDLGNDRASLQELIIESGDEHYPYRNLCGICGECNVDGEGEVFCSDCEAKPENQGDTDN